ncbi:uncharacterized protein RHOBADRAFT_47332 [Rhodotorula graminis WP1]|uniref:Uncharacterized protein n=1 Tax=Rhodotorula graminis (strain WP1) TaxID=578459 RepID=A0A0P9EER6_RHOGW|nr:uncharacterized protein RHOBADRAFT_47332 [Rhodotorula graminis WP1]KPV71882.1 hypothetical protein RHOBADRAFT_47332 [Rhodotorula graminis WP1]
MTKGNETHELSVEGDKVLERTESGTLVAEKDYDHVVRGYKAAEHNPRFTEQTHKNAEHIRHDLEAAHDEQELQENQPHDTRHHHSDSHAKDKLHKGESHEDEVHRHRVIGGYKGTLHRDGVSEEAKEHAREKLRELGENTD